ncbi:MAG: enoyl-CoA hydratase-related protein, partial [Actinomycetota bacterium]
FTGVMMRELLEAFNLVDADDAVHAVIVTGDGKAFCAGADLAGGIGRHKSLLTTPTRLPGTPN